MQGLDCPSDRLRASVRFRCSYTASVNRNPYLQDRAARMREGHYDGLLQTEATAEPPAEPAGSNSPLRGSHPPSLPSVACPALKCAP